MKPTQAVPTSLPGLELCAAAAAADHMSASHRRRFRGVFTSCRTPAIMLLAMITVMPFTMKLEHLQKQKERCGRVLR